MLCFIIHFTACLFFSYIKCVFCFYFQANPFNCMHRLVFHLHISWGFICLPILWAISTISMKLESCGKLQIYCISSLHYCPEQLLTRGCRDVQIKPVGITPGVGEWQKNTNKPVRHLQTQVSLFRISILNSFVVGWTQWVDYDMIAWWGIVTISRRSPRKDNKQIFAHLCVWWCCL